MRAFPLAERYRKARSEFRAAPMAAQQAFRVAKSQAADFRFWAALVDPDENFHAEFREDHGSYARYQIDQGGALRIELEWVNDSETPEPSEFDLSPESLVNLFAHFRESKLGKAQALDAAREVRAAQEKTYREQQQDGNPTCGLLVRVYWRGVKVAADSIWGNEASTDEMTYGPMQQVMSEALYQARKAIRAQARETRSLACSFGFPPLSGYVPAAECGA